MGILMKNGKNYSSASNPMSVTQDEEGTIVLEGFVGDAEHFVDKKARGMLDGLFIKETLETQISNAPIGVNSTSININIPEGYEFDSINYFYCSYNGVIYCCRPNNARTAIVIEYRIFQAGNLPIEVNVNYIKKGISK